MRVRICQRASVVQFIGRFQSRKTSYIYDLTIDIRGFTGLETPNELHNRGALTDAHAHAALIILIVVKRDQYSLLSRQLK